MTLRGRYFNRFAENVCESRFLWRTTYYKRVIGFTSKSTEIRKDGYRKFASCAGDKLTCNFYDDEATGIIINIKIK